MLAATIVCNAVNKKHEEVVGRSFIYRVYFEKIIRKVYISKWQNKVKKACERVALKVALNCLIAAK